MNLPCHGRWAHSRPVKRAICLLSLVWAGCGGSAPPIEVAPPPPPPTDPAAPPPGALWRRDVVRTVDAGLGHFLQHIEVEPKIDGGAFGGFRIVRLVPPEYWEGVDLQPGDVILRVNALPIERDSEAYAAFQSLKEADELTVLLIRDGQERELHYRILDRAGSGARAGGGKADASTKAEASGGKADASRAKPASSTPPPTEATPPEGADE